MQLPRVYVTMRVYLLATGLGTLVLGARTPIPQPSSRDLIRPYRTWIAITPSPVNMEPQLALLCRGPSEWDSNPANPHVPKVFRVFVNPVGERAFRVIQDRSAEPPKGFRFPVGTIVVKEKFSKSQTDGGFLAKLKPGAKPELLTVMIKREKGFSPANGDWEYQVMDRAMTRVETRKVQPCQNCHQAKKSSDFVFAHYGFR
ncbi:MAG: cytochrome P460 family protein [Fimbriimonas sp.]